MVRNITLALLLFVGSAEAQAPITQSIILLDSISLLPGETTFGPISIPPNMSAIKISVDRANLLSPTLIIKWELDLSLDGGITFILCERPSGCWGGGGTVGGVFFQEDGITPRPESSFTVNFRNISDIQFQIKGKIITNEIVLTSVTATITP